jgi:pimeloyl-ACP methyl ester carboxylesterase
VAAFTVAQLGALASEMRLRLRGARPRVSAPPTSRRTAASEVSLAETDSMQPDSDAAVVAALRECATPILVLHGVQDLLVPISNSRALVERLGGAARRVRLVEFDGCGHVPHEELPQSVADAIAAFAEECDALAA